MRKKITKRALKKLIKEAIDDISSDSLNLTSDLATDATDRLPGRDFGYGEGDGRMVKHQLDKINRYAQSLHDILRDSDELPEWVKSKISVMYSDIGKIKHYLEYKMQRMEE
jgi:hypothetical protein